MTDFAYLRAHCSFGVGGGPGAPAAWVARAVDLGYRAVGLAGRSPLAEAPELMRSARAADIAPLYGVEIDIALPSTPSSGRKGAAQSGTALGALLLAVTPEGVGNLARVASAAYAGWPAREQPVALEALTACAEGLLLVLLPDEDEGAAAKKPAGLDVIAGAFEGWAYVGLSLDGGAGDEERAKQASALAKALGLPLAATPVARYLLPEGSKAYAALREARRAAGWAVDGAPAASAGEYLRSPDEVAALYARWPDALESTARIIEACSGVGAGSPWTLQAGEGALDHLLRLAESRLPDASEPTKERLRREAAAVVGRGAAGAWIALAAVATRADGAAGGRVVPLGVPTSTDGEPLLAHALGISPMTPPEGDDGDPAGASRALPGVELPAGGRAIILRALAAEYGEGRLASPTCRLDIAPLQAVRAAAATLSLEGDSLRDFLLATFKEGWATLDAASTGLAELAGLALALKGAPVAYLPDPDVLAAAPRQVYGSATLASRLPLVASEGDGLPLVPWTAEELCALDVPAVGLPASPSLAALDAGLALARRYPVPGFAAPTSVALLPDLGANEVLSKGDLGGVPYLAAPAVKGWHGTPSFDEVAVAVAKSLHPGKQTPPDPKPAAWDEVTAPTKGALLFKDQLARLVASLGISGDDLPRVLRALRHPQRAQSAEAKALFAHACTDSGLTEEGAESLWKALAGYAKKAVSRYAAAAWGRAALWSVALKTGHPAAFVAGLLNAGSVRAAADEAARLGVRIAPPDANASNPDAVPLRDGGDRWAVLWGLRMVPGWVAAEAERFAAARPRDGFGSLREVVLTASEAGVRPDQLGRLILLGGCDNLGGRPRSRDALLDALPTLYEWAEATRGSAGQLDLFSAPRPDPAPEADILSSEPVEEPGPRERYGRRAWELEAMGVAFTPAPEMEALKKALEGAGGLASRLLTTAQIAEEHAGTSVYLVGVLCGCRTLPTGRKDERDPLAVGRLEDLDGEIELIAFPPNYRRHAELWAENTLVVVTARVQRHAEDGDLYLLCEHLAPWQAGSAAGFEVTVRPPRKSKQAAEAQAATPTAAPTPASQPKHEQTVVAAGSMGTGANGHTNGHGSGHRQGGHSSVTENGIAFDPAGAGASAGANDNGNGNGKAAYSVIISLPATGDEHSFIDNMIALKALLAEHGGSDIVTLRVPYSPETGRWTSARLPWGVSYTSQLETRIQRLLGSEAVAVIKLG